VLWQGSCVTWGSALLRCSAPYSLTLQGRGRGQEALTATQGSGFLLVPEKLPVLLVDRHKVWFTEESGLA
jgi:hypothetical protein